MHPSRTPSRYAFEGPRGECRGLSADQEEEGGISQPTLYLFEYDKRFQVYEEFTYYDFNHPLEVPCSCMCPSLS